MKLSLTLVICILGIAAQVTAKKPKQGPAPGPDCQFQKNDCKKFDASFKCEPPKVGKCVHNPVENYYPFCACVPEGCVAEDQTNVIDDEGCDKHCKKQDSSYIGSCTTDSKTYSTASPKCVCKKECKQDGSVTCGNFKCAASEEVKCVYRAPINEKAFCACEPKGCFVNYGAKDQKDVQDKNGCDEHCRQKNGNDFYGLCVKAPKKSLYEFGLPQECHCQDGSGDEIAPRTAL